MRWIEGLKIWNAKKGGAWCVPRKGSPEHAEVKAIMANAPAKAKVDKLAEMELAEAQKDKQTKTTNFKKLTATSKESPVKMEVKVKPRVSEEVKKQIQERKVESKKEKVASFLRKAIQKKRAKKGEKVEKKEEVKEKPKNVMIMPSDDSGFEWVNTYMREDLQKAKLWELFKEKKREFNKVKEGDVLVRDGMEWDVVKVYPANKKKYINNSFTIVGRDVKTEKYLVNVGFDADPKTNKYRIVMETAARGSYGSKRSRTFGEITEWSIKSGEKKEEVKVKEEGKVKEEAKVKEEELTKAERRERRREDVSELKRIKMLMDLMKDAEKLNPMEYELLSDSVATDVYQGRYRYEFTKEKDGKESIIKESWNVDDLRERLHPENFTAHELRFLQKHHFKLNTQKPNEVSRGESTKKAEEVTKKAEEVIKETDIDKVIHEVETMPLHDSKNIVIGDTEYVLLSVGNIHTKNRLYTIEKYGKNEKGKSVNVPFTEEEQATLVKKGYTSFGRKNSTASKTILSKK